MHPLRQAASGPWNIPQRLKFSSLLTHANGAQTVRVSPAKEGIEKGENAMKRFGILMATTALGVALVASTPAAAFRGGHIGGWHGGGWHRAGWHGGWHGGGWRGAGWRGAGWRGGWAGNRWAWNRGWGYPNYGYGYGYPYGYGLAAAAAAPLAVAAATTAPLVTGRSVATGQVEMGNYCSTPAKNCLLYQESWVGNGCSCRVPGGRSRGSVTQ